MKRYEAEADPVDRLVCRYLQSEAEQVDAEAFLAFVQRRRRHRRLRVVVLHVSVAAAALVLLGVGIAVLSRRPPRQQELARVGLWDEEQILAPLRDELASALRGAQSAGFAAVSAGAAPLQQFAAAGNRISDILRTADRVVNDWLGVKQPDASLEPEQEGQ